MTKPAITIEAMGVCFRVPIDRTRSFKEYWVRWTLDRVRLHRIWALQAIDLQIERGQIFGIIGSNGAGKSTLLRVLARVLRPTQGRVTLRGSVIPILGLGIGFNYELTGRENVYLYGTLLGLPVRQLRDRFDAIVEFAGLWEFIDAPLRTYSNGMVIRLAFATATALRPEILLIDEVLAVGDETFRQKSLDRIEQYHREGTTVVFASHDPWLLKSSCQKAAWLKAGRLCAVGEPEAVWQSYRNDPFPELSASENTEDGPRSFLAHNKRSGIY